MLTREYGKHSFIFMKSLTQLSSLPFLWENGKLCKNTKFNILLPLFPFSIWPKIFVLDISKRLSRDETKKDRV